MEFQQNVVLLAWTAVAGNRADFATAGKSHGIPLNASAVEKAGKREAKEVRYALMFEECTEWTSQNYTDTARFASSHVQPEPGQGKFTGSIQNFERLLREVCANVGKQEYIIWWQRTMYI